MSKHHDAKSPAAVVDTVSTGSTSLPRGPLKMGTIRDAQLVPFKKQISNNVPDCNVMFCLESSSSNRVVIRIISCRSSFAKHSPVDGMTLLQSRTHAIIERCKRHSGDGGCFVLLCPNAVQQNPHADSWSWIEISHCWRRLTFLKSALGTV